MGGFHRLPLDTLKLLFSKIDVNVTVRRIEAVYVNSGRGRPRYPVRSMLLALLFMRFEATPSIRKLCRRLERRQYAREICEFNGRSTPNHTTFSKFITKAEPKNIENQFKELRDQAFRMGIIDPEEAVKVSVDSTFMKAYSRRGRKGGISDRGARIGKTERRSYELGWSPHSHINVSPSTYLHCQVCKRQRQRSCQATFEAGFTPDQTLRKAHSQGHSRQAILLCRRLENHKAIGAEPIIPHPTNVKDQLINLWVTKRFRAKGDPTLVNLYKLRMTVERGFKSGKLELMMENLRWRGIAKVRMHVAICFTCMYAVAITAHKIGRPELANSVAAFTY